MCLVGRPRGGARANSSVGLPCCTWVPVLSLRRRALSPQFRLAADRAFTFVRALRRAAQGKQRMPGFTTSRGLAQFRRGAPQRNNGRERRRSRGIAADMCHVGATAGGDRGGRGRRLRERLLPPFPIPQQPDFCATSASTPRRASRPTRHNPPTHPTYLFHPCPLLLERAGRAWKGGGASVRRPCEAGGRVAEAGRQRSGDRSGKSARRRHLHAQAPWLYPLTMASRSRSWAP